MNEFLDEHLSFISASTQFIPVYYGIKVKLDNSTFIENSGLYVDDSFNNVFDFKILAGDHLTMFHDINSIAVSKNLALKFFGALNVLGKQLIIDDGWGLRTVFVTGIFENPPDNSSIQFDYLLNGKSYGNWDRLSANKSLSFFTFIKFNKPLETKQKAIIESSLNSRLLSIGESKGTRSQYLQALEKIHLSSGLTNDLEGKIESRHIYILGFIASVIVVLTTINFINTNTVQSWSKVKLLGILKILGDKNPIVRGLAIDSVVKCVIAYLLSVMLIFIFGGSLFQSLFEYKLVFNSYVFVTSGFLSLALGLLAGFLSARILKTERSLDLVNGRSLNAQGKNSPFKLVSLTVQFSVVILLLIVTSIIIKQINYIDTYDQGYNRSSRLIIPAPQGIGGNYSGFVNSLRALSGVELVGTSMFSFYDNYRVTTMKVGQDEHLMTYNLVNEDFLPSLEIELLEGKNFEGVTTNVILNETAATKIMGEVDKEILNTMIEANIPWLDHSVFRVIGVMKDFNFKSLKHELEPLVYFYLPSDAVGVTSIKFNQQDITGLRESMSRIWEENGIDVPFEYKLMEDAYSNVYFDESLLCRIAKSFVFIAFFLSLFGLITFLSHSLTLRKREWAIKRVLGASPLNIFKDLNWELLAYFGISIIISLPLAYHMGDQWLSQFAYRFNLSIATVALPPIICLTTVLLLGIYFVQAIYKGRVSDILKVDD